MTLTWANLLTLVRALCIAPMLWCMLEGRWAAASVLFVVAALTDYFDGPIARRLGQASPLGGVLDHATDALFVSASAWIAASLGMLPAPLGWLILAAFLQYLLDSKALAGQSLRASKLGRYNGVAYFVLVGVVVIGHGIGVWPWLATPVLWAGWLLVATTVLSMADRAVTLISLKRSDRTPSP